MAEPAIDLICKDAGFRMTGITHGTSTLKGSITCVVEKIILREPIKADEINYPGSRPVDVIDARVTAEFIGTATGIAHDAARADVTVYFNQADGGTSGSVVVGQMLASSITHDMRRNRGGFGIQQVFELEGPLTYTPTA